MFLLRLLPLLQLVLLLLLPSHWRYRCQYCCYHYNYYLLSYHTYSLYYIISFYLLYLTLPQLLYLLNILSLALSKSTSPSLVHHNYSYTFYHTWYIFVIYITYHSEEQGKEVILDKPSDIIAHHMATQLAASLLICFQKFPLLRNYLLIWPWLVNCYSLVCFRNIVKVERETLNEQNQGQRETMWGTKNRRDVTDTSTELLLLYAHTHVHMYTHTQL